MAKIYGAKIYRGDTQVGWFEGTRIYDENGNRLGYWQSKTVYKESGEQVGYVSGDYVYYADDSDFASVEKCREQIQEGDCSNECCAAVALLFGL